MCIRDRKTIALFGTVAVKVQFHTIAALRVEPGVRIYTHLDVYKRQGSSQEYVSPFC
ncbi:hypothetical protein AZ022_002894, partial [Klebsiella pneumoniae]